MGTGDSKGLSREMEKKRINQRQIPTQFEPCHQRWVANPNYLNHLLIENPKLFTGYNRYFPNAHKDYEQFTEMVMFLRKIQIKPQKSLFAKYNAPNTSLIDRYFMLILGIDRHEQLGNLQVDDQKMEDLFIQLMKLYIPNPKKGFIAKLKKFIGLQSFPTVTIKQFSSSTRQTFPQIYKQFRDYTTAKFRQMQKQAYLLNNFKSNILQEDAVILSMRIPEMGGKQIKQLYSSDINGLSFHSYEKRIIGYAGPWLLLVESQDKQIYKFGAYQQGPINDVTTFQGDLRGFLFSIEPNIRFMTTDKGQQGSNFFYINTIDEKVAKIRRGIGFGGDRNKQNFKLWIDQDLDKSTVFNGNDPTYGFGNLANPMSNSLSITKMEIWGLGSKFDLEKQANYWQERQDEAMRRRKVNKKQLIDGNAGMFFEKTFQHRDQIVGEIHTKKEQE